MVKSRRAATVKYKTIHEQGLVSVLRQLHDELDEAVLRAYGWKDLWTILQVAHGLRPAEAGSTQEQAKQDFTEAVLERLVALNAQRAAEEARGHIRWLRPEFQAPDAQAAPQQTEMESSTDSPEVVAAAASITTHTWPKDPIQQVRAVAELLQSSPTPLSLEEVQARFKGRGRWKARLPALLDMLVAVGQAQLQDGRYAA